MASIVSSGTITTTGSLQTVASDGGTAFYVASLETSAMAATGGTADVVDLYLETAATAGGTIRACYAATYAGPQGTAAVKVSPPMPAAGTVDFKLKRVAGADRSYAWALWKI